MATVHKTCSGQRETLAPPRQSSCLGASFHTTQFHFCAARVLAARSGKVCGRIRHFFQPGEVGTEVSLSGRNYHVICCVLHAQFLQFTTFSDKIGTFFSCFWTGIAVDCSGCWLTLLLLSPHHLIQMRCRRRSCFDRTFVRSISTHFLASSSRNVASYDTPY